MKKNAIYGIMLLMISIIGMLFTNCVSRIFVNHIVVQSIKYNNKTIELYITELGAFATTTISISIFSWYNDRYVPGNIYFAAYWYTPQMNINLNLSEEIPTLEVYYYSLPKESEIYKKEESINGIKVKYIKVDENFKFSGYDTEGWGKGNFDTINKNFLYNYRTHSDEVGAKSQEQYLRKAKTFSKNLKGAVYKGEVKGLSGVERWEKNGKYIDIDKNGDIISFGKNPEAPTN